MRTARLQHSERTVTAPLASTVHNTTVQKRRQYKGVRGEKGFSPPSPKDETPEDQTVWPDWYATLYAIPGFKIPLTHAQAWLDKNNIAEDHANITSYALKSKWPGPPKNPYKDPWATFQNWAKRPALAGSPKQNLAGLQYEEEDPTEPYRRLQIEYDADVARVAKDRANGTGIFAYGPGVIGPNPKAGSPAATPPTP